MATTPNFLWLQTLLKNASTYLAERATEEHRARFAAPIGAALNMFQSVLKHTDEAYLVWRKTFNDVICAHKQVRIAYNAAREECVEWGLPGFPDLYVSYLEEDKTQAAAERMIAFLESAESESDWAPGVIATLRQTLDAAQDCQAEQIVQLAEYRREVKLRTHGYEQAFDALKDFFSAAKHEIDRDSDEYSKLSPYPVF